MAMLFLLQVMYPACVQSSAGWSAGENKWLQCGVAVGEGGGKVLDRIDDYVLLSSPSPGVVATSAQTLRGFFALPYFL
jgi:hypothetical protein